MTSTRILCAGLFIHCMRGSRRGGQGVRTPPPLKNHKNIGFLSNTGPDSLKNQASIQCWASIARQRNAISMAFRWQADYGPLLVLLYSSLPKSTQKMLDLTKLSESAHVASERLTSNLRSPPARQSEFITFSRQLNGLAFFLTDIWIFN